MTTTTYVVETCDGCAKRWQRTSDEPPKLRAIDLSLWASPIQGVAAKALSRHAIVCSSACAAKWLHEQVEGFLPPAARPSLPSAPPSYAQEKQ